MTHADNPGLKAAKMRIGSIARAAKLTANNERINRAKKIMASVEADAIRRADPYEHATAR